jgi:hypothetical protein
MAAGDNAEGAAGPDAPSTGMGQRVRTSVTSSGLWQRLAQEAGIPVRTPRWFIALRALSKSLVYGLVVAWAAFVPLHGVGAVALWLCVGVLWATTLTATVIDFMHRRHTGESRLARISDITMLLAPLPALVNLPAVCIILLVAGYIMQLRRISAGQVFMFALVGSVGAIVLGTVALVGAESQVAQAPLSQPEAAIGFTLATLFRLTSIKLAGPVTSEGHVIVVVLQVFSAVFLGAFYGGLLAMVVRDSSKKPSTSKTDARLAYVIKQQQEILARLDALAPPQKSEGAAGPDDESTSAG